jgi:hypothetical protein
MSHMKGVKEKEEKVKGGVWRTNRRKEEQKRRKSVKE